MSPLLPPTGVVEETYLVPYPLELLAIVIVLDAERLPPPVSPLVPVIVMVTSGTLKFVLAAAAVLAPVPPLAMDNAVVRLEILPPVIATSLAFCVPRVPMPREVLAAAAVLALVPPELIGNGVDNPEMLPPVIATVLAFCVPRVPTPREVLAAAAVLPPVPPELIGNGVDNPDMLPPVIATALAFWLAIVPTLAEAPEPKPRAENNSA